MALVIIVLLGGARFFAPLSQAGGGLDAGVLAIGGMAMLAALGAAVVHRKVQARQAMREWAASQSMKQGAVIEEQAIETERPDPTV